MPVIYGTDGFNIHMIDVNTAQIVKSIAPPDRTTDSPNWFINVGSDGLIYFGVPNNWPAPSPLWATVDQNLSRWTIGPNVDVVSLGAHPQISSQEPDSVVATDQGVVCLWNDYRAGAAAVVFPSNRSGTYTHVYTWPEDEDDEGGAEGGFSDGTHVYYTTEGRLVWDVDVTTGATSQALNLNDDRTSMWWGLDFDLSAAAIVPTTPYDGSTQKTFFAYGYGGSNGRDSQGHTIDSAVFSGHWGTVGPGGGISPGVIKVHAEWASNTVDSNTGRMSGYSGGGVILGDWYYFNGGYCNIARLNIQTDEFQPHWFTERNILVGTGGTGRGSLAPISGAQLGGGVRLDPHAEPRGMRMGVRS